MVRKLRIQSVFFCPTDSLPSLLTDRCVFPASRSTRLSPTARQSVGRANVPTIHYRKRPLLSSVSGPECIDCQPFVEPPQPYLAKCVVLIFQSKMTHKRVKAIEQKYRLLLLWSTLCRKHWSGPYGLFQFLNMIVIIPISCSWSILMYFCLKIERQKLGQVLVF